MILSLPFACLLALGRVGIATAVNNAGTVGKKPTTVYHLDQSVFDVGTYRILQPGKYVLDEDIVFAPQKENDYWPPMELWGTYPPSSYYLGFFAAITIECDNVVLDLNGFEISQSDEFYLLQRFFNVIQLNNKVFVDNEGVSSLNYQKTDKPVGGPPAGSLVTPTKVVIKNGSLGQSSHSGIHGNSVIGLKIKNVHIHNFEISGIHCNGCRDVRILNTEVGPGAQNVPVLGTFSNSRFFQFFTETLIPKGFGMEPDSADLLALFDNMITFADRPEDPVSVRSVFDRNNKAVNLYRRFNLGYNDDLSGDDQDLLAEAKRVFDNRFHTPDGSVMYGIILNRRGVPTTVSVNLTELVDDCSGE